MRCAAAARRRAPSSGSSPSRAASATRGRRPAPSRTRSPAARGAPSSPRRSGGSRCPRGDRRSARARARAAGRRSAASRARRGRRSGRGSARQPCGRKPTAPVRLASRDAAAVTTDLMLITAVALWAFNFTVTRFVLTHGFHPLAYSLVRYGTGSVLLLLIAWRREGSLWIARRDLPLLVLTALIGVTVNQVTFVYSLHYTTATTVALLFGATPVFAMAVAALARIEVFSSRFVVFALLSLAGVALVALGSGGGVSGNLTGDLLGLANAATFALYTVAIVPLMRRYSPFRISALVISIGTLGLLPIGIPQLAHQSFHLRPLA